MPSSETPASGLRVAVDARPLDIPFLRSQGIGRYAAALTAALGPVAAERGGELVLLREGDLRRPPVPVRFADLPEQLLMRFDMRRLGAAVCHFLSIYRASARPGVPSVVTVHDVIPLMWPDEYLKTGMVHRLLYRAARAARRLIADSGASRDDAVRHLGVDPERIDVVYLAAEDRFRPTDPGDVPARYGIDGPYVLYVSGLENDDPRKNVSQLIEEFGRWSGERARSEALVLTGKVGAAAAPLRELAARGGARVVFTDYVPDEDLPALYAGARCLVTATRYEGFGLPQLEALACGTPVACFEAGALPEVVGDGGLIVPLGDAAALLAAVERICDDDALRDRLGAEGLRQASKFSWRRAAEQTWDSYERAAAA